MQYVAGVIDAIGNFRLDVSSDGNIYPRLELSSRCLPLLQYVRQLEPNFRGPYGSNGSYVLVLSSLNGLCSVLDPIKDTVVVKRSVVDAVLTYVHSRINHAYMPLTLGEEQLLQRIRTAKEECVRPLQSKMLEVF